ncbi:MAG: hypothetical protein VX343_00065 [Thermodesulfobacteriota bacterium]|nr:hypothetical protein [Thermodesulfobacteriota bacterium]|tara:strand:+ start:6841 stop:7035 length:195 start_codon:yes stop_codon:yes gene_type:complete
MTFKEILKQTDDQVLKGLILKVKNETMKDDIEWKIVRKTLKELLEYDEIIFSSVVALIVNKKYK